MFCGVIPLQDVVKKKTKHFGNKAINLSYLLNREFDVLPGFCIIFDLSVDYYIQIDKFAKYINEEYKNLTEKTNSKYLIVRSSADIEDSPDSLFPGLFKSVSHVSNISDLYMAIKQCFDSVNSKRIATYIQEKQISTNLKWFTVIVQEEITPEYSGIAFTHIPFETDSADGVMLTQVVKGNNHKLLNGSLETSNTYSFFENKSFSYRCIEKRFDISLVKEENILKKLYDMLLRIKSHFCYNIDVEWGYKNGNLFLFQVRYMYNNKLSDSLIKSMPIKSFVKHECQGLKFQAMDFFVENELFPKKVFLFTKEMPLEFIALQLKKEDNHTPLTVRFSSRRELGLPRYFSAGYLDAIEYIRSEKKDSWAVIVHESINVLDSYEIYLDSEKIILEHVPGMWETDSKLISDTIIVKKEQVFIWLAQNERMAKYESNEGCYIKNIPPLPLNKCIEKLRCLFPMIEKIRTLFKKDLPLNIHFVSDQTNNYVLNCRWTPYIDFDISNDNSLYTIKNLSDFEHWDGKTNILFKPEIHRGEEFFLCEYIPLLKKISAKIYIEFGLLSHPAIMLREFGIEVLPIYLHHQYYKTTKTYIMNERENSDAK